MRHNNPEECQLSEAFTKAGALRGFQESGIHIFLGVPFAAPPIGALRWKSPQPVESWDGVRDATRFGNRSYQPPLPEELLPKGAVVEGDMSEDCLYLNIYTPETGPGDRPVILWIHGGGYLQGSANDYHGKTLARENDCIVVMANYRLGVFGFCDFSELGEEYKGSVSRGFEDQIAALKWIKENISEFGGDPSKVSIWGESGGAGSVLALQGAKSAEGLFHSSIAFSPGDIDIGEVAPPNAVAALRDHLSLEGDIEQTLLNMPAERLFELFLTGVLQYFQTVDGTVITEHHSAALRRKGADGPPLMSGSNLNEASYLKNLGGVGPSTLDEVKDRLVCLINARDHDGYVAFVDECHPNGSDEEKKEQIWNDLFRASSMRNVEAVSQGGGRGWLYHFAVPTDHPMGVTHGAEIAFSFGWFGNQPTMMPEFHPDTPENRELSKLWRAMLVQFARTGDPNGDGLPAWRPYSPDAPVLMEFDIEPHMRSQTNSEAIRKAYGLV